MPPGRGGVPLEPMFGDLKEGKRALESLTRLSPLFQADFGWAMLKHCSSAGPLSDWQGPEMPAFPGERAIFISISLPEGPVRPPASFLDSGPEGGPAAKPKPQKSG